jgi:hypothetical protein
MDRQLRDLLQAAAGEPPHRVTVEAVHRRVIRRRVVEFAAGAAAVAVLAAIIPLSIGALDRSPGPPNSRPAASRIVTSRHYGYTEALPAGWRLVRQATRQWGGTGAPGDGNKAVDLFQGPGGVEAWVYAAPTKENLAAYAITTVRTAGAAHSCPVVPQTNRAITIGGAPARLLDTQCPARSGFLVELAVTIRHGTAFVFGSQNPSGMTPTDQPADRAAFHKFLAGMRLQR